MIFTFIRRIHLYPVLALTLLACSQAAFSVDAQQHTLLVDTAWVKERIGSAEVVLVDTRDTVEYQKGHLPGAINIPVESTFSQTGDNSRIGSISQIRNLFSQHGLKNTDHIVLYDAGRVIDAARFFWVLEVYGHHRVSIMDGGLADWERQKYSVQTAAVTRPQSVYIPSIRPNHIANQLNTRLAMTRRSVSIIDSRSSDEYAGKESKAKRFGHIPTAINIPWSDNYRSYGDNMTLRTDQELRKLYANQNVGDEVITYCNRGKQSALTYFVLRKLGYKVSVYDGAWLEWGNDDQLPISQMSTSVSQNM